MTDSGDRDDLDLYHSSDWEYLQQHDTEPETGSDRRRRSWRRHKFASLDTKSWDQAKQTISKGKISITFVFLCLHIVYPQSYYLTQFPEVGC